MSRAPNLSSFDRVMTALSHKEPDRVPVLLSLTMHGAKELGLGLQEYFSRAENVAEGQLRLLDKYGHDFIFALFHAAVEAQAFGGEAIFYDNGPPNIGQPVASDWNRIPGLAIPDPCHSPPLREVLRAIEIMAARAKGRAPIVGVVVAPMSVPSILMGLDRWMELLLFGPDDLRQTMLDLSTEFCIRWANAQLAAGATAIALADPVSSSTIIAREQFLRWSLPNLTQTVSCIKGPTVLVGVGWLQEIIDLLPQTGIAAAVVNTEDDLATCKKALAGKVALIGNLNNVEMARWTAADARSAVRACIQTAASGGGYVLAPQWEIPYAVTDEVLFAMVDAARRWGTYPLRAGSEG